MEKIKQIGYLGPEGTFSHEAVLNYVDEDSKNSSFRQYISYF